MKEKDANDTNIPLLHIYGQEDWHDEVMIVGNLKALKILHETIGNIIESEADITESLVVFANDGEGYKIAVITQLKQL